MKVTTLAMACILFTGSMLRLPAAQTSALPMEFVKIVPGEFMTGCVADDPQCDDEEKPAHRVRITKPFELGKYEVTQAQWQNVMGTNPSRYKGESRPRRAKEAGCVGPL